MVSPGLFALCLPGLLAIYPGPGLAQLSPGLGWPRGPLERDVNSTVTVVADCLALIQRTHVSTLLPMAACELQADWGLISASECVFSCSGLRHKLRDQAMPPVLLPCTF